MLICMLGISGPAGVQPRDRGDRPGSQLNYQVKLCFSYMPSKTLYSSHAVTATAYTTEQLISDDGQGIIGFCHFITAK